jgi:hypothetical protein
MQRRGRDLVLLFELVTWFQHRRCLASRNFVRDTSIALARNADRPGQNVRNDNESDLYFRGRWLRLALMGGIRSPACRPPDDTGGYVQSLARAGRDAERRAARRLLRSGKYEAFSIHGNPVHLCWYGVRMRLSPILPVSLAVAAVAVSASQGNTVVEPDKRANHGVVAFPLFALKSSDRTISSNNHYSHESHSSHYSHVSGGHSSHFSSAPSSPPPAPVTTAPAPAVGSPTVIPAGSSGSPVPSGSGPAPSGSGGSPISSFSPSPTGNTSSGGDAAPAVLAVLVVTVAGGVTYTVYRNRRPR